MKDEYDFTSAQRGAVAKPTGKSRITIYLDDDVLAAFRARARDEGKGYQTLINEALRDALTMDDAVFDDLIASVRDLGRHLRGEAVPGVREVRIEGRDTEIRRNHGNPLSRPL
jgi:hypothetical protein